MYCSNQKLKGSLLELELSPKDYLGHEQLGRGIQNVYGIVRAVISAKYSPYTFLHSACQDLSTNAS